VEFPLGTVGMLGMRSFINGGLQPRCRMDTWGSGDRARMVVPTSALVPGAESGGGDASSPNGFSPIPTIPAVPSNIDVRHASEAVA